ncbi:MAG TPA: NifB/NifX family molybdenum-iron cluster-binding protein [Bacteroidales bacterium]|nr:NifB/NifX family molybdenum-iron cluster-binding protein [Bacteroidales bacterium]
MNLRFAFAVNKNDTFEKRHFGDADKYLIFESENGNLFLIKELENIYKDFDEQNDGKQKKGVVISNYLKQHGVNVIVSQQFGQNIKEVNKHFIPVVVYFETIDSVKTALADKLMWINEEFQKDTGEYKLYKIKSGILKMDVEKYE